MEEDNLGLGALQPEPATPDFDNWGWHAALSERSFLGNTVVETTLALKTFDVAVRPKNGEVARLTPEGLRGNYFNELNRESTRVELGSAVTYAPHDFFGAHLVEIGGGVAHTSFSGTDRSLPVEVFDVSGRLKRRIDFVGDPKIGGSDVQASGYVQDQWRPTDRVGIDLGLRYDYDRLVGEHQLAPRIAGAWVVDESGRTAIKAGWGLFYDHVFLHFDSFERYQTRIETEYGVDGQPVGLPLVFRNRLADEDIEVPRSTMWNVELDRSLLESVQLRINYRARAGSKQMIVDRIENGTDGALLLSSRGESSLRELDITARIERGGNVVFASYVRSRSTGDLNNFGTIYQNLRSPLLFANESSLLDLDVTNRFLFWGVWKLKWDIVIAPGIEWRTGFPYTVLDADYAPSGERNRGGRYPSFLSADVRVTKGITVKGRKLRVGFQIFNLGGHVNPREVVNHLESPRFGSFLNSPDMGIGFRLSLGH
jgi:outer membrane receptor protein involved in Fe transport